MTSVNVATRERGNVAVLAKRGSSVPTFPHSHVPTAPAFSLAEMMIALAILAMGLLVIGAALPIGMRYTRTSINLATGEAAAEYGLDTVEQNVAIPRRIFDSATGTVLIRESGLFVPRDPTPGATTFGALLPAYEPVIKVRPLFTQNILANSSSWPGEELFDPSQSSPFRRAVMVEELSRAWMETWLSLSAPADSKECVPLPSSSGTWLWPALPSVALVYPPISPDSPIEPNNFLSSPYQRHSISGSEPRKAMDQRTVATTFYRRVSYAAGSDPFLYELITVVVRVPSAKHRFPVQDPSQIGDQGVLGYAGSAYDCAFPVPWLVYFDVSDRTPLPAPTGGFDATTGFPIGVAPATVQFYCVQPQSGLFPIGAVVIPARNDYQPPAISPNDRVQFGPLAPDILPIYEVVERPSDTVVVAKFNGYYPLQWQQGHPDTPNASLWPVWVIPPAFEELNLGQQVPAFPDRSPIVAVARRYVRLREVP